MSKNVSHEGRSWWGGLCALVLKVGVHWYGDSCAPMRAERWTETLHCSEQCLKPPVFLRVPHCLSENGSGGCCFGRTDDSEHEPTIHFLCPSPEPTAVVLGTVESTSLPPTVYGPTENLHKAEQLQQKKLGTDHYRPQSSPVENTWVWIRFELEEEFEVLSPTIQTTVITQLRRFGL